MWLNVGDIRRQIDKHAGAGREAGRSLYAHFFSAKEEQGIYGRLTEMVRAQTADTRRVGSRDGALADGLGYAQKILAPKGRLLAGLRLRRRNAPTLELATT